VKRAPPWVKFPKELIQNSDDACAVTVLIKVASDAIYIADDGNGLTPAAVKSLSGTHLSVKPAGCIGRKALGFKSVLKCVAGYLSPLHGLEFILTMNPRRCAWLSSVGLSALSISEHQRQSQLEFFAASAFLRGNSIPRVSVWFAVERKKSVGPLDVETSRPRHLRTSRFQTR
jgi:hypothetical protein